MALLTRQRVLAAKIETTPGTAESVDATDADYNVYADGPIITPEDGYTTREGQSALSRLPGVPQGRMGRARFSTDLVGAGSAANPQWASAFLASCGMVVTSQTWTPLTGTISTNKTATLVSFEDGMTRTLAGAVGTWTINLIAGQAARIDFEYLGIYGTDADVALLAPTYPTTIPPRWSNSSGATYDSVAMVANSCTLAMNNVLKLRENANTTSGYQAGIITDRRPTFRIDPETVVVATKNWATNFYASTAASLAIVVGTASNNIITITMPKAVLTEYPGRADRDGILTTVLAGEATRSAAAGDDEVSIVFT